MIYFEVRSSSHPGGQGEILEPSRFTTREDAEKAARRESAMGFFSQVWSVMDGIERYLCEYAAKVAA